MRKLFFSLFILVLAGCSQNELAQTLEGKTFYTRRGTEFSTNTEKSGLQFFIEKSAQEKWNVPGFLYFDGDLTAEGGAQGKRFSLVNDDVREMKLYTRNKIVYQEFTIKSSDESEGRVVTWPWGTTDKSSLKHFDPYQYLGGGGEFKKTFNINTRSKQFSAVLYANGEKLKKYIQFHGLYELNIFRDFQSFFTDDGLPTGFFVMTESAQGDFTAHAFFDNDWIEALPETELKLNDNSQKKLLKDSPGLETVFAGFYHAKLPLDKRIVNNQFEGVLFGQKSGLKNFHIVMK